MKNKSHENKSRAGSLLTLLLCAICAICGRAFGQISGAGQFGCNAAPVTGTAWSSGTTVNSTQTLATNIAGTAVTVVLDQTSTISGGAVSFQEDYGDGSLVTVSAWQVVDPTSSTFPQISLPYTLVDGTNKVFLIQMGNAYKLVLKLTTAITGSATVTPYTNVVCYAAPAQNNIVNGTLAVTQSSGPWTSNLTQVLGATMSATNPLFGAITDAINGPVSVKPAAGTSAAPPTNTTAGATNANPAITVTVSPNTGIPAIIQKTSGTGSGSQASLVTSNFGSNVTAGNSIVVVAGIGNNGAVKFTDTLNNEFTQAVCQAQSTTFQVCIGYATNVIGGTDAVTVTPSASVSLNIAAYEVSGIIGFGGGGATNAAGSTANYQNTVDCAPSATSAGSTTPTSNLCSTRYANEIAFGGIALGTANQTPAAFNPWNKDYDLVTGGTPSGLFGLHTFSHWLGAPGGNAQLNASITSEPWATAIAVFKPATMQNVAVTGSVAPTLTRSGPSSYNASANFAASSTTDNACLFGNATDTVELYEVDVSGVQTTAGIVNTQLIRRSSADSGGTSSNMTTGGDDTANYAVNSSTPVSYTGAGPSVGSAAYTVDQKYTAFLASSTATPADLYLWKNTLKPQILIGTAQGTCVNMGNAALTGGNMSVVFRWYEVPNNGQ